MYTKTHAQKCSELTVRRLKKKKKNYNLGYVFFNLDQFHENKEEFSI